MDIIEASRKGQKTILHQSLNILRYTYRTKSSASIQILPQSKRSERNRKTPATDNVRTKL